MAVTDFRSTRARALADIRNREDDSKWPQKNKDGRQELEIRIGNEHISFEVGLPRAILGMESIS